MITQFATKLTPTQVEQVHEASLEILEYVGLLVRNEEAKERLGQRRIFGLGHAETDDPSRHRVDI